MGTEMRDPPYLKGSGFYDPPPPFRRAGRSLYTYLLWISLGGVAAKSFKLYCSDFPILGPHGLSKWMIRTRKAA